MEEDIPPIQAAAKWPKYVPPQKGRVKVPKDLDAIKDTLITPSLPKGFPFEGTATGRIPTMKFED